MIEQNPPKILDGTQHSYIIHSEKTFSEMCARLYERGITAPEKLSVMRFYSLINTIEEDNKKRKAERDKRKAKTKPKTTRRAR